MGPRSVAGRAAGSLSISRQECAGADMPSIPSRFSRIFHNRIASQLNMMLPTHARTARRRRPRHQLGLESLEHRLVLDSTVVFNEIMYHPVGENENQLEWIELYNQLAVDMDISDWVLSGAVDYKFPDGTIVPGRGHLVVAANPAALQQARVSAQTTDPGRAS